MIIVKLQMPDGGNIREVERLIEPSLMDIKFVLEGHYSTKLAPFVVEEETK